MDEKDFQYLSALITQLHVEIGRLQRRIAELEGAKPKPKEK